MVRNFLSNHTRWIIVTAMVVFAAMLPLAANADLLELPASLTEIESEAFYGDAGLDEVVLPEGLKTIGSRAFAGTSAQKLYLPASLTNIAEDAFADSPNLRCWGVAGTIGESFCLEHGIPYDSLVTPAEYFTYKKINDTTAQITGYTGEDTEVYIPAEIDGLSITAIGDSAFWGLNVTAVYFPSSLTGIGKNAFRNTPLTRAELPDSVTSIGMQAFMSCPNLEYFRYPLGWSKVASDLLGTADIFKGSAKLTHVDIPEGVVTIPASAFKGCASITEVTLPSTVTAINDSAFWGSGVTAINFPSSLTGIGKSAFRSTPLVRVELPDSVTSIGMQAFMSCPNLEYFRYPLGWSTVATDLNGTGDIFKGSAKLTHVDIPEGVVTIPASAFKGCASITEVTLPSTVTAISDSAFWGSGVTTINFPSSLTGIGKSAFRSTPLVRVELPDSVTSIGMQAFMSCPNLEYFRYPLGWSNVATDLNGTGNIFNGSAKLTHVDIPEGVVTIPANAFRGCTSITEVTFSNSVTTIGASAFRGSGVVEVELPASLTVIGDSAFRGSALTSIHFPAGLSRIGAEAFQSCSSLTELEGLSQTALTYVGQDAFASCTSLTAIQFPDSVTDIGMRCFEGCTALESFHYPISWNNVPGNNGVIYSLHMFYNAPMKKLTIPEGVTKIPDGAFYGANNIEEYVLPSTLQEIGFGVFKENGSLTAINVPSSVYKIGNRAFESCTSLEKLYLSPHVTEIGATAVFDNCPALTVWCELGSYALDYMQNHSVNYYYLSPDGVNAPSGNIYEGEGGLYGYARTENTTDPSVVLTEVKAVLYHNGSVYRQCTVNPNATECNIGAEINSTLSLWTLPLGTYRYTLSASTAWSTENWVDTTFTVVEKIPVFTWRELDGNPSFVPAQGQYKITGEIVCNFEITNLSIEIVHATSGTVKTYNYIVTNPVEEVRFRTELLDAGELEHGLHDVTIYATALGQKEAVHTFSMAVANGSVIDDTVREEIIAFVNDRNQYSFSTESGLLQDKIRSMSLGDQICMAWSDFSGQTRQFLLDWVSGNNRNTFYVELYKADIAALIAEINEKGTYPSSEMPEWLEEFKKYAVKVGSSGATITLGEFSAFEDLWTLDAQTWKLTKYSTIYKDELKTLTQFKNLFKYTGSFIDSVDTATKYSSAFLKSFCSVFEVHYRDLALLASIYESGYGDTEYRRAVEELTNEYQTRFGTAIATIMDQIKKTVIDAGFKLCEKAVLEYAGATATGYLALAKLGAEIILKVSGIKDHGTNWQDFFVKYSSQQVLAGTYQSAVEKVRSDGSKATDDDINKLQMLFSAYREATARTFEALAKVDTAFARDWNAIANGVRARKMPGVD